MYIYLEKYVSKLEYHVDLNKTIFICKLKKIYFLFLLDGYISSNE